MSNYQRLRDLLDQGISPYQALLDSGINPQELQQFRIHLIREIQTVTGRPLIVYAAHFSRGAEVGQNTLNVDDKLGFADAMRGVQGTAVDVLLHSPGGSAEVAEQLAQVLRATFQGVRFVIAYAAKSAATMLALSGDKLLMDERSELGPIDPQIVMLTPNGPILVPAQTILDGFEHAREIIQKEGASALPAFLPMLNKYDLHTFELCKNSTKLSMNLVKGWLAQYMFNNRSSKVRDARRVAAHLCAHRRLLSHARPIGIEQCLELGLEVEDLRKQPELREKIWQLHSAYQFLFDKTPAVKIYENAFGTSWMRLFAMQQVVLQPPPSVIPQPPPPTSPPQA